MTITNYFVEVHPGEGLANKINTTKNRLIGALGEEVTDDPTKTQFLRDDPHFTLMCARTGDMEGYLQALRNVVERFPRPNYTITNIEDKEKGGLIETHTVTHPEDVQQFVDLHYAVMEASLPFNTEGNYERFNPDNFSGYARENLDYCGFPSARELYKPHASLGRLNSKSRLQMEQIINEFKPQGTYTSGDLIFWRLPFVEEDPTSTPVFVEKIRLTGK